MSSYTFPKYTIAGALNKIGVMRMRQVHSTHRLRCARELNPLLAKLREAGVLDDKLTDAAQIGYFVSIDSMDGEARQEMIALAAASGLPSRLYTVEDIDRYFGHR